MHPECGKKILFVFHEASLSGAPIVLLGLMRELKNKYGFSIRTLVVREGPLMKDLSLLGDVYIWQYCRHDEAFKRLGVIGKKLKRYYMARESDRFSKSVLDTNLVFLNTVANGNVQDTLRFIGCPMVTYVHELQSAIRMVTNSVSLDRVLSQTDYFLAASAQVQLNLVENHGVPFEKTAVLYPSLKLPLISASRVVEFSRKFRISHSIPERHVVVGLASNCEWRKGFEWIFPLIRLYFRLFPVSPVVFVWKGYRGDARSLYFDMFDFRKTGLDRKFLLLPHDAESIECLSAFDIHLLLSREDPYPLVMLEAAALGIPTISFADAGGSPEFIQEDAGVTVPYGDLYGMAVAIERLVSDTALRKQMGICAKDRLHAHHDLVYSGKVLGELLDALVGRKGIRVSGRQLPVIEQK